MAITSGRTPEHKALFNLLCKAAGVEDLRGIRGITCAISIHAPATFTIDTLGEREHMQKALADYVKQEPIIDPRGL